MQVTRKENVEWGMNNIFMYELILDILDRKGSVPIPDLCQELEQTPLYRQRNNHIVHPSTVKSVITRKSDLFLLKDDLVTIHPERQLTSVVADVGGNFGSWYKVEVDFTKKLFTYFEWHKNNVIERPMITSHSYGDVDKFKYEMYRMSLWDWEPNYQEDGIVLDGTSWSITVRTVAKVYESKGLQSFPHNWRKFCLAVQSLTGKPFH